jgi:hypothetical protein
VRVTVNHWIRHQPLAIDVEQVMGDGRTPPALKPAFNGGDWIHPTGDGPKVLAKAVALSMLRHERVTFTTIPGRRRRGLSRL